MPELRFFVRWPDGSLERCSAPSPIVREYLTARTPYALDDFLHRSRCALHEANARSRRGRQARCTASATTLATLEAGAARFAGRPDSTVVVEGYEEDRQFCDAGALTPM